MCKLLSKSIFISGLILTSSCQKLIEIDPPLTQITTEVVFQSESTSNAAVAALYNGLKENTFFSNNPTLLTGLCSDELVNITSQPTFEPFRNNSIMENSAPIASSWAGLYNIIYRANSILKGLENSPIRAEVRNVFKGEALWVRAFSYFYLVNLYGDVPLVLTTDVAISSKAPRNSITEVYSQMVLDLKTAFSLLPTINTYANGEKSRVNKATASALLARIYLYQGQWKDAEDQASSLIENSQYQLLTDINAVVTKNNVEAIFQLANNATIGNSEADYFLAATPIAVVTQELFNAFETGDQRKSKWLRSIVYQGKNYSTPYKYKITTLPSTEWPTLIRLGEMFLIRAEARARQNKLTGTNSALSDLNSIRLRAGLLPIAINDQPGILSAIEKERQVELFAENGHRWFDLKRTGRLTAVLQPIKGSSWNETDALFPLPSSEIQKNPKLVQNPGY